MPEMQIQSVYHDVSAALQDVATALQRELEPAQIASLAYVPFFL